jgi:ubiquinone/menaquinone biosynthesis C-methylase UbiE
MDKDYTNMQIAQYDQSASSAQVEAGKIVGDTVVGSFDQHNVWTDHHEFLIRHSQLGETKNLVVLDFACGPGRNILLYKDRFQRIDGVDLSLVNLANAKKYTSGSPNPPVLYHCNGLNLENIPSETYDVIISTIALQHVCCHSIRFGYLKEFNRVLKKGGFVCIQMGFGNPYPEGARAVKYLENNYLAYGTNGHCDTRIEDPKEVEDDLVKAGFSNFEFNIRPSGPGDGGHPNWIYWSSRKV